MTTSVTKEIVRAKVTFWRMVLVPMKMIEENQVMFILVTISVDSTIFTTKDTIMKRPLKKSLMRLQIHAYVVKDPLNVKVSLVGG